MGSFVLGITCGIEMRLRACVLVGGGDLDGPGGYWDRSNHTMCQAIPYKSLLFLGDRGAVFMICTPCAARHSSSTARPMAWLLVSPKARKLSSRICGKNNCHAWQRTECFRVWI